MTRMLRTEYEVLLVEAAKAIHQIGCWASITTGDEFACPHHITIYSGEAMEANAAFQVLFEHLGLAVPKEILA